MNIPALLSTKERLRVVELLLFRSSAFGVSETAAELGLSKGLVSKVCATLLREGLAERDGRRFRTNSCPGVRGLRLLFNLSRFDVEVFRSFPFVRGAGIYGSAAKGEDTEGSDLDLYVLVDDVGPEELARLTSALKEQNELINPLYLSQGRTNLLRERDPLFHHALFFGSVRIFGEGIEEAWR